LPHFLENSAEATIHGAFDTIECGIETNQVTIHDVTYVIQIRYTLQLVTQKVSYSTLHIHTLTMRETSAFSSPLTGDQSRRSWIIYSMKLDAIVARHCVGLIIGILIGLVISQLINFALTTNLTAKHLTTEQAHTLLSSPVDTSAPTQDEFLWNGEDIFLKTALSFQPVSDKVTTHTYQIMYGQYLLPYYRKNPKMKMLEIGLGCDMVYGPGASVAIHKKLFPTAELWEAEYDASCVEKAVKNGMLEGINTLTGDQGNVTVLDRWIEQSGGDFDVVIDDGGHLNCQIWTSFVKLWPTVKPGGLYFIEDMQVATHSAYNHGSSPLCEEGTIVPDKLKGLIDTMIYDTERLGDIKFIFCQSEACVLGKRD
jgi:hypothetical protein